MRGALGDVTDMASVGVTATVPYDGTADRTDTWQRRVHLETANVQVLAYDRAHLHRIADEVESTENKTEPECMIVINNAEILIDKNQYWSQER